MPLGISRINSLARFVASGAVTITPAVYQATLDANNSDSIQAETGNNLAFCGFNTTGKPVYISVWNNTDRSEGYVMLFNIDVTDGTITPGTKYTFYSSSTNTLLYPVVTTEMDNANLRLDLTSSNYAVIAWRQWAGAAVNKFYAQAGTFNLDDLTLSLGTTQTFSDAIINSAQSFISYTGTPGEYTLATRGGNNGVFTVFTKISRTGTTLSVVGTANQVFASAGQFQFVTLLGLKNDRLFFTARGNNADRVEFQAVKWVSDSIYGLAQNIQEDNETNTQSASGLFNASDSYINIRNETQVTPTNTQVEAGIVNWETGTTTPTLTLTNQIEVDTVARNRLGASNGAVDGEAYVWHYTGTGTDMKLHKFSLSGSTLSQVYSKDWTASALSADAVETDNHTFVDANGTVGIVSYIRNSSNGHPTIRVIVEPDDL